jgi:C-terminal processing protease CtpA/Prc
VAVLVEPATGSSGEILALVLRARPRTRSFGEPTAHQCNATTGFLFGANAGYLLLTTNYVADAHQRVNTA